MSPCIFSCVICGYLIYHCEDPGSPSWTNQFRILYKTGEKVTISGLGIYDDADAGDWKAPPNFNARWDDAGYNFPDSDCIGVLRQPAVNGQHGFPFHEACWSLLDVAYHPQPIPIQRLFEACRSLPSPSEGYGLSWGHSYGGITIINNQDHYPWEDRFIDQEGDSEQCETAWYNPYCIPQIQQLLTEKMESLQTIGLAQPRTVKRNCFSVLPPEICIQIALYLPTADALRAGQVVRSFMPIICSNQFWASRFSSRGERSWVFESWARNKATDWRSVYRRTNKAYRNKSMENRVRIWGLIQQVQQALIGQWSDKSLLKPSQGDATDSSWVEATADLRQETTVGPYHDFNEGCRLFHEQETAIPAQLAKISLSFICVGGVEYVAGIRLTSQTGEFTQLGYRVAGKETVLSTQSLVGFNLAIGSRGIQGIQCVVEDGRLSPWFGSTVELPHTRRLAVSRPITYLKAGFDGLKMVGLAIAERSPPMLQTEDTKRSLHDCALWYPRIPRNDLCLNDEFFQARGTSTTRYQPLCWTLFAGHKGQYMHHLTGISVTSRGTPQGIEFHFNTECVPATNRKVGRWKSNEYAQVSHFDIDGPGGEFISAVEIYTKLFVSDRVLWFYRSGRLESFKIWTNRGRSYHFRQNEPRPNTQIVQRVVKIAPGSVITGFYWSQHENSLTALGVISEDIEMPTTNNTSEVTAHQ